MSDFDRGMNDVRRAWNISEKFLEFVKAIVENIKDTQACKNFLTAIGQQDSKHPVVDATNTTLYDTTGYDPKAMSALCTKCNIPNIILADPETKSTLLAVPNQFAPQANKLLSYQSTLYTQIGTSVDKAEINKLLERCGVEPSKSAMAPLLTEGSPIVKSFDNARWMPLAQRLEEQGIPMVIAKHGNTTDMIFAPLYSRTVHDIDKEIAYAHEPAELSYSDFMKRNLGKNIIEHTDISEGQARLLRQSLCGASMGYNLEKCQNGDTYVLRYTAEQEKYIAPVVAETAVVSHGPNEQMLSHYSQYVQQKAEEAYDFVSTEQPATFVDAEQEHARYVLTQDGLKGPDGKLMISKKDEKFAEKVYTVVNNMHAPVVKGGDAAVTTQEIALAKNTAAKAQPTEAQVLASQIVSLKTIDALAHSKETARVTAEIVDGCQTLSKAVEEETFKLSPEELTKELKLHGKPDVIQQLTDVMQKLSTEERSQLSDTLKTTADTLSSKSKNKRKVEKQDLGMRDLETALDRDEERETFGNDSRDDRGKQPTHAEEPDNDTPIRVDMI